MSFGDTTSTGMTSRASTEDFARSVSAFFDTRDLADKARRDLIQAGIPDSDITVTGSSGATGATSTTGATTMGTASPNYHEEGFWDSLKELFMPEEDRYSYAEGLRRGGYLLSVRTDTASYNRVVDILDRDGAVDLDEREASWRSEGWTGYTGRDALAESDASYTAPSAGTAGFGASAADRLGVAGATSGTGSLGTASTGGVASRTQTAGVGEEESIPVVEENVRIGKRDVSHGRVRIRSYVVETPVSENVTLRSESVQVERRPVDRAVTDADRLFQDRTIEAEQYSEEAVVQKDVRVKEEISLRKDVEQRTETVSDTVRRTEVEVQDERGNVVGGTKPVSDPKKPAI